MPMTGYDIAVGLKMICLFCNTSVKWPVEEFRFREGEAPAEPDFSVFAAQQELRPPFFNGLLMAALQKFMVEQASRLCCE